MKEYSLICSFGNRKPFILDTFNSLDQAIAKIYEITNMDSEEINSNKKNNIIEFKNYLL